MTSIHGHEVLNMMLESDEQYSETSLIQVIHTRFGESARFHTCSAENMTAAQLVEFLKNKGKFIPLSEGFLRTKVKYVSIKKGSQRAPFFN